MLAPIVAFFVKTPKTFALSRLLQYSTPAIPTLPSLSLVFNTSIIPTFNTIMIMVMVVVCVFFLVFLKVLFCTHSRIHSFFDFVLCVCMYSCIHVFVWYVPVYKNSYEHITDGGTSCLLVLVNDS